MRLIDADELLNHVWDADTRCGYVQVVDRGDIEEAPTVVELVRCRDCKHLSNRDEEGGKCWRGSGFARVVENNDFCSHGERSEK